VKPRPQRQSLPFTVMMACSVPGSLIGGNVIKSANAQAGTDRAASPVGGGAGGASIGGKSASGGRTDMPHRRVEVSV
jgi:hypothetical protein